MLGVDVAVDVELVRILGVFRGVRVPLAPDLHVKLERVFRSALTSRL